MVFAQAAQGDGVVILDTVGAIKLSLNADRPGAALHGIAQYKEHIVQIMRSGVVGRTVQNPAARLILDLARPVVAVIILFIAWPEHNGF